MSVITKIEALKILEAIQPLLKIGIYIKKKAEIDNRDTHTAEVVLNFLETLPNKLEKITEK